MTLCPVAITAGCKKCPIVGMCPLKTIIGDFKAEARTKGTSPSAKDERPAKKAR